MTSVVRMVRLHLFGSENDADQQRAQEDVSFLHSALGTYGTIDEETRLAHPQQDDASSSSSSSPANDPDTVTVSFSSLPSYQVGLESQSFEVFKHKQFGGNDSACELTDEETTSLVSDEESFANSERSRLSDDYYASPCGRGISFPGWAAYNKRLDTDPVITKALTSLCGWFLGDFFTQTVIEGGPFDVHRSLVLASFGFFFHGPVGHFIYNGLDELVVGNGPKEVILKIIIDQILWCPIFMIAFFTYLGLADGNSLGMIFAKIQTDLLIACQGSWKVWPLAHSINFKFVSTKHRIVYINCIEVCFIMFLSLIGNTK